jgi:hypothetical protein
VPHPRAYVGAVTTQGDAVMRTDILRSANHVDGSGVKVGVLSTSANEVGGGLAASQATGDLPAVQVLQDELDNMGTDEGRAMLEIVHDIAPGAILAYHSGFNGPQNFADGIHQLAQVGSNVEVDDIGYANSPMYNDGVIAQAVEDVANQGVFYASAAGNDAAQAYITDWHSVNTTVGGISGQFLNVHNGSPLQPFTLATGGQIVLSVQWDSAFLEGGSPLPNFQVPNEVDVLVTNATGTQVFGVFNSNTLNTDEAFQFVTFTNSAAFSTNSFALAYVVTQGPAPSTLRWVTFGGDDPLAFGEGSPTTFGQPADRSAVAVAAAAFNTPTVPEPFTSVGGPLTFLFDRNGNRLNTPDIRNKPEITAPDGVSTTVPGFAPFFGTSAAAPHVAGAAALLLQMAPGTPPANLAQHFETTALDIGVPGFDSSSGFGLLQATPLFPVTSLTGPIQLPPGAFPPDQFEPDDTSDTAHDFGTIHPGDTQSFSSLTISNTSDLLPDYDWYKWEPSASGSFTATINIHPGGDDLELHVFTLVGNTLTEIGQSVTPGTFSHTVTVPVAPGQPVFVEVKGFNSTNGAWGQGVYDMQVSMK